MLKISAISSGSIVCRSGRCGYFAIIAVELQKKSGLTADQYTVQAKKIFSEYALAYLQRVQALHAAGSGTNYKLIIYSDEYFKFISSDGYFLGMDTMV